MSTPHRKHVKLNMYKYFNSPNMWTILNICNWKIIIGFELAGRWQVSLHNFESKILKYIKFELI